MTTIAYKEGVMASDTLATTGDEPQYGVLKLAKTDRFLLGFSGRLSNVIPMFHWVSMQPEDRHPLEFFLADDPPRTVWGDSTDTTALIADREGQLYNMLASGHIHQVVPLRGYESAGSGADIAVVAMRLGRSATESVAIATEFDINTGGKVAHVTFDHPNTNLLLGLTGEVEGVKQVTVAG